MPKTSVHRVISKDMSLTKLAPKFVPHILTDNQRHHRVALSETNLQSVRDEPRFLDKIITGDESWLSLYETETKIESCEWVERGQPRLRPIKALRSASPHKVMMIIFYDSYGVLLIHFVPHGETVDSDYYVTVLNLLKDRIRHKRPGMWKGGADGVTNRDFIIHHDNASPHVSAKTLGFFKDIRLLPHPQYFPDLAPCEFFMFPHIKSKLRGRRFPTMDALQEEVREILKNMEEHETHLFYNSIRHLAFRWKKCVAAEGHYFEGRKLQVDPISEAETSGDSSSSSDESDSDTE